MFKDRVEAASRIADQLRDLSERNDVVVAGIPREGTVVSAEVARELGVQQACLVVCKIGTPCMPDVTMGAIDPDGEVTLDPTMQLTRHEVRRIGHSAYARIKQKVLQCRGDKPEPSYTGKTVVVMQEAVTDDMVPAAAAGYLRKRGAARIILAAPAVVQPLDRELCEHFDDIVALSMPTSWTGPKQLYMHHNRLTDSEIEAVLKAAS